MFIATSNKGDLAVKPELELYRVSMQRLYSLLLYRVHACKYSVSQGHIPRFRESFMTPAPKDGIRNEAGS